MSSSKNFDEDDDVSRIFARHTNRAFQRDFAEFLPARQKSAESKNRANELNVKLIEAQEKIDQMQRSMEAKNREIQQLQAADADAQAKAAQLREEVDQLKAELNKLKRRSQCSEQTKLSERLLMEDFRTALSKFRTWYCYAQKQMEVMKSILKDTDKWNESNRYKIYFSYKDLQPLTVNDSDLPSLCEVPVCAYSGIEEIEAITNGEFVSNVRNMSTQTDQLESGFLQLKEDYSRPSSQAYLSQQLNKSFCEESSAAEQWRYLELTERLQKLESENAKLRDETIILKQRNRDNVLLAERKSDVEAELQILKEQNLSVIVEHERLKDTIRSKLFQDLERHNANEIIRSITDACTRNAELEKQLAEATAATIEKNAQLPADELKRIAHFFSQKYQTEIDELQRKLAKFQQPSDTTCVYRFQANNPLDEAYEEYLVSQAATSSAASAKRRKLDSSNSDAADERATSEDIRELRRKVEQSERLLKLQKECALEYRQVVTALTGYQVKMREEGLCEVQSVFGAGGTFCFKRRENSVDLLDNECAQQWKRHVTNYLAKYNSVPAFLASIVLMLVEGDASMMSTSLLDYTRDTHQVL